MLVEHKVFEPSNIDDITFDFSDDIKVGETINEIDTTIVATLESDDSIADILEGAKSFSSNVYTQKIKNLEHEKTYFVTCVVKTTLGNSYERSIRLIGREE